MYNDLIWFFFGDCFELVNMDIDGVGRNMFFEVGVLVIL